MSEEIDDLKQQITKLKSEYKVLVEKNNELEEKLQKPPEQVVVNKNEEIVDYQEAFIISQAGSNARKAANDQLSKIIFWLSIPSAVLGVSALVLVGLAYNTAKDLLISSVETKVKSKLEESEKKIDKVISQAEQSERKLTITSESLYESVKNTRKQNREEIEAIRDQRKSVEEEFKAIRDKAKQVRSVADDLDKFNKKQDQLVKTLLEKGVKKELEKYAKASIPVGSVVAFSGEESSVPPNWRVCDGRTLENKKGEFDELYGVLGSDKYGGAKLNVTLPDYRGYFLRGVVQFRKGESQLEKAKLLKRDPDLNSRSNHKGGPGPLVGSIQTDSVGPHIHDILLGEFMHQASSNGPHNASAYMRTDRPKKHQTSSNRSKETRPKNVYVHWIIKVK